MESKYKFNQSASTLQMLFQKLLNFLSGSDLTGADVFSFSGDVKCTAAGTTHRLSNKMDNRDDIVTISQLQEEINNRTKSINLLKETVDNINADYIDSNTFESSQENVEELRNRVSTIEGAHYPRYLGNAFYKESSEYIPIQPGLYVYDEVINDTICPNVKKYIYKNMQLIEDESFVLKNTDSGSYAVIVGSQRFLMWSGSTWEYGCPDFASIDARLTSCETKLKQIQAMLNDGTWNKPTLWADKFVTIEKTDSQNTPTTQ